MDANRWQQLSRLYHAALARRDVDRAAFLAEACGGDEALRRDVESLLAQPESAQAFLDGPAMAEAARMVSDVEPLATLVGRRLGAYQIQAGLGAGGMGEVYRARDTKLGRDVAIKILPRVFTSDPDRVARFGREARVLAALNHSNIAAIYGLEDADGIQALVLELVEGETLAERITRGPIPVDEALPIARQIAEALEAAHEQGIIHRDLKPANVKVREDGTVKVLDFGLAKLVTGDRAAPDLAVSSAEPEGATRAGAILGTAAYMSPEQARGKPVDRRADIWAFGCVLFEMLTGTAAFGAATMAETLVQVIRTPPKLEDLPPATPRSVRRLLQRCLDKNPKDRLQHIGDARIEIRDALATSAGEGEAPSLVSVPADHHRRAWALGIAALVTLAATVGAVVAWRGLHTPTIGITRLSIGPVPLTSGHPSGSVDVALSRDGTRVAYATGHAPGQLWMKPMDQPTATPLAVGFSPFFSPDGEWLGFVGPGQLQKVSLHGGAPIDIAPVSGTGAEGRFAGAAWGPDGTIVFATSVGLFAVSDNGGEPTRLLTPPEGHIYAWPHFMPDGRSVLFTVLAGSSPEEAAISLLDLRTMTTRVLYRGGVGARYIADGYLVYATGAGLAAVAFDPGAAEVRGNPVEVPTITLQPDGTYLAYDFATSDVGTLAHMPGNLRALSLPVWVDRDGSEEVLGGFPRGSISYPRLSPQGDRVAFNFIPEASTDRRIWVQDLERRVATQVSGGRSVEGAFEDLLPQWSADGNALYFGSNRSGPFQLYRVAADGSGTEELVVAHPDVNMPYRVERGERLFFFSGEVSRNSDVGYVDVADSSERHWVIRSPYNETNATLSPDGHWLAYQSDESGDERNVFLRPFPNVDSGRRQVSIGGGVDPLWDPRGGDELYFRNAAGDMMAVTIDPTSGRVVSGPTRLFANDHYRTTGGWSYDISPTDGRFLLIRLPPEADDGEVKIWITLHWTEELKNLLASR